MIYKFYLIILFVAVSISAIIPQTPETEIAQTKITRIWGGIAANGDQATLDFRAGFFPNDFDLIQYRGQGSENYLGSGFRLACTNWIGPDDSLYPAAVFGPRNDYLPFGKVTEPITNYVRYPYTDHTVNQQSIGIPEFGVYDPAKFSEGTFDQIIQATYKNILGVEVKRRVLAWSQSFNDNYVIIEVELTNTGVDKEINPGDTIIVKDTLRNFYFSMSQGVNNNHYSNGSYPAPPSGERPNYSFVWQHYYGGREGDSLRVFYFYSADDPLAPGDNMGSPVLSQHGRLLNSNMIFYSIIHASKDPFTNPADDVDDFLQPKVTYIGTETKIPSPGSGEDPYGSKNYWAISGGYSSKYKMPDSYTGTSHGINNDELGISNFSNFPAGTIQAINSKNFSSFGPYNFPPDHKIRIVYAVGISGIGMKKASEVGEKWLNGALDDPPGMPDPVVGWFPPQFKFPDDATELDKKKDRWISMGIDSVHLSAWRANWNYKNGYQIPAAPPPPEYFSVKGSGQSGVLLEWKNDEAELMDNFAGYTIMRRLSNQDTVDYQEIYSSGPEDKAAEHLFADTSAVSGAAYYYYMQTKAMIDVNDQNADPTTRGKLMYSSRLWIPNIISVSPPPRTFITDDMSRIRVVPNPYNINDPYVKSLYASVEGRRINFYNLPEVATIKIYTENGDLVKTLDHNKRLDNDGQNHWNLVSDSQQVISSGLYIAVFQKPSGEVSYQKFIVVR